MQTKKIVLITGANRGLGLKLAEVLIDKYQLILTSRKIEEIQKIKIDLEKKSQNPQIRIHQLDISDNQSIVNLKNWLHQENIKLDVLVNNAGMMNEPQKIMDVNLIGTINITEQLLPLIQDNGKILLVSSVLGKLNSQPEELRNQLLQKKTTQEIIQIGIEFSKLHEQKYPIYSASKALLNAYGRYVLSEKVQPNQSIYCMHPGWIQTDMGGPNAPGTLDEGVYTSQFLINNLPFQRDVNYHGKYINDKATVEDF